MKGDTSMKKIALILTTMAFVLAWGSAFAMEMKGEINNGIPVAEIKNGITLFTTGLDTYDRVSGKEAEVYAGLDNGSTIFAVGPVEYDSAPAFALAPESSEIGSAAGGLRMEGPAVELHNGITLFDGGPNDYVTSRELR